MSGEWMLKGRANSGAVVLARCIFVGVWLFLLTIGVDSYLDPSTHLSFDWPNFLYSVREKLSWFGVIAGAVYAALYTRFSSQWQYLAGLYNQLMAAEDVRPRRKLDGEERKRRMMWWHAFIADAQDVHLALKPTFVGAVHSLLEEREIVELMSGVSEKEKKEFKQFKESVLKAVGPSTAEATKPTVAALTADSAG